MMMSKKKNINFSLEFAYHIRRIAYDLSEKSDKMKKISLIKNKYDIKVDPNCNPECISKLFNSLQKIKPQLVIDCGIKEMSFEDMGVSKEYFPNHGKYINDTLVLNDQILNDDHKIEDENSDSFLDRFDQTFYHELGHGWDETNGNGSDLSLEEDWTSLSGWSKYPKPGLKRIHIKEKGTPEIIGEYYYSPDAKFTRFYAKRNPWDDWADSFSYYIGGLTNLLPRNKVKYFDNKLSKYN
jgi:hypothetical protein